MSSDPNAQSALEFASAEEEARRRREAIIALFRGRLHWAILLAVVLGSAAAVVGYFSQKPEYQGQGLVVVNPEVESIVNTPGTRTPAYFQSYLKNQINLIMSRAVAERALATDTWKQAISQSGAEPMNDIAFARSIEAELSSANDYNIVVGFTHDDPLVAEAGVNAALFAYQNLFRQLEAERTENKMAGIKSELLKLRQQEAQYTQQINARLATDRNIFTERLAALNDELIGVNKELRATQTALSYYTPGQAARQGLEEFQDPIVLQIEADIAELEAGIDQYKSLGYGDRYREVEKLRVQINSLKSRLQRHIQELKNGDSPSYAHGELASLQRAEKELLKQAADLSAEIDAKDQQLNAIAPYELQLKTVSERIEVLENEEYKAKIEGDALKNRVEVAQYANAPSEPHNGKKRFQLAVLGFMAGSGMGLGLVVLVGLLDSRLRHAADAKNGLRDVRLLGALPSLPDDLADPDQAERAAHAVNHIRTLLQISGPNHRVFSVTGPAAGSGKSSLTVALGLSFAASGNKVLLIDGDIVGAGLTRRLGAVVNKPLDEVIREDGRVSADDLNEAEKLAIRKGINLMDALVELGVVSREESDKLSRRRSDASLGVLEVCNGADIEECIAETGIPHLFVLPVGAARPEDAGLLSPKSLRRMLAAAREAFDIVLIDTGPVLGSLEASIAGAEADGTVLIVSRGDSRSVAARSLEHLQSVGARVVGTVFNHALDADLGESSYGSMVSQDRRGVGNVQVDPAAAARFGPLGSAVATYAPAAALRPSNGRAMATAGAGSGTNGQF